MLTTPRLSIAAASLALVLGLGWVGTRAFAARPAAADTDSMPSVGQVAPNFTLPSQAGTPTSLSSFRGKWVVLYFYPKDMTSGCTLEAHNFQQDAEKYDKLHAVIVGVSVDSVDSHKEFCAKDGLAFHLLSDTDKKVVSEYGSLANYGLVKFAKRNTFLINPEGKIVKVWTGVDPAHHSTEVLAELDSVEHKG
jgi:peroxiredoxin Q/BCP